MTKKLPKCEYEYDPVYKPSDVINKDLDLLLLSIFLEAHREGRDELKFSDFLKGNYWNNDDIRDEVLDTNDHFSIEDMVLGQIDFLIEDQRIGNLIGFVLDDPSEALHDAVFNATKIEKPAIKEDVMSVVQAVEQISFLEYQDRENKKTLAEKDIDKWKETLKDRSVFISKGRKYPDALMGIIIEVPHHIKLKFLFDERGIEKMENEINDYIAKFRNDQFKDKLPRYLDKRPYFAQQIESFYRYVAKLELVGDTLNIPFSILSERGFEAVKVLKFLELNNLIELRWSDEGSWKVKFNQIPITPNSLLGINEDKKPSSTSKLKFNLSFTPQTGILVFSNEDLEHKIKIQGQVQKEVLRVIFQDPENTFAEWSLYEISEILGQQDTDTTSVKNAIYQLNKKVKMEIPELERLFDGDQHSVILNEKYIVRN